MDTAFVAICYVQERGEPEETHIVGVFDDYLEAHDAAVKFKEDADFPSYVDCTPMVNTYTLGEATKPDFFNFDPEDE